MPFRTPSYHVICITIGIVLAMIYELLDPRGVSAWDVVTQVAIGTFMGDRIGAAPPDIRPRIHRSALLGAALGAAVAIAARAEPAAIFVIASLGLWAGAFMARSGWEVVPRLLKWSAIGMIFGLAMGLLRGGPILAVVSVGGLFAALLSLTIESLKRAPGQSAQTYSAAFDEYIRDIAQGQIPPTEQERTRAEIDQYEREVERSLIPYRQRAERGRAANLQQTRGEDSSEEP